MSQNNLIVNGHQIPIDLHIENRRGYRASFTKKGLTLRIPRHFSRKDQETIFRELVEWAKQSISKKPTILNRYRNKNFKQGDTLPLFDTKLTIKTKPSRRKTFKATIIDSYFVIEHPIGEEIIDAAIIAKLLAQQYRSFFTDRLNYWNQFFPRKYIKLRLKYNASNWGSCSGKGNINLSTRLLLCPLEVIDYVIVHECAHLIHQNHSKRFWQEVERVMPHYRQPHSWLKKYGSHLDFIPTPAP